MTTGNPFTPPRAPVADAHENAPGSALKAVALGFAVDTLGTVLGSFLLGVAYGAFLLASGTSADEMAAAMANETFSLLWWLGFVLGSGFSVLGGYVCARIARHSEYRLASAMALASIAMGLALHFMRGTPSMDELALGALVTWACNLAGARLGVRRNRSLAPAGVR